MLNLFTEKVYLFIKYSIFHMGKYYILYLFIYYVSWQRKLFISSFS